MAQDVSASGAAPPRSAATSGNLGDAVFNALKLILSLFATWGVALVIRLALPRFLGPEQFGVVNFADSLTATVFVLLTFGVDTFIRKEIAVREKLADDFFGTLLLGRAALTGLLLAGLVWGMEASGQNQETRHAVYLFAIGQFFFVANNSLSALLQARGKVDGLSVINVVAKVLWGVSIAAALALDGGPFAIAATFIASEALRTVVLYVLARRNVQLELRWQPRATLSVLLLSAPFFVSVIAQTVCTRIGASMLGFFTTSEEVGFYGSAWTLAGMALMLAPLLNWVLMPFLSHAAERSEDELFRKGRRAVDLVLAFTTPVALALAVGAEFWVTFLFGEVYQPASRALRVMAPVFVLTYVAMVSSTCLILQNKAWKVTSVAIGSLILNPLIQVLLVPRAFEAWGSGGPGIAAALALLVAELVAVVRLTFASGGRLLDRRNVVRTGKIALVCGGVAALYPLVPGSAPLSLVLAGTMYIVGVLALGAFPLDEVRTLAVALRNRSR